MTPAQLKDFLKRHNLSAEQFADIIGVTAPAVSHWTLGRRSIAKWVGRLCRMFDKQPALMKEFRQ